MLVTRLCFRQVVIFSHCQRSPLTSEYKPVWLFSLLESFWARSIKAVDPSSFIQP